MISNIEKPASTLGMSMSIQSITDEVLRNIKRENMRLDDFLALKFVLQKAGLDTNAEVILGVPNETIEIHINSMDALPIA